LDLQSNSEGVELERRVFDQQVEGQVAASMPAFMMPKELAAVTKQS